MIDGVDVGVGVTFGIEIGVTDTRVLVGVGKVAEDVVVGVTVGGGVGVEASGGNGVLEAAGTGVAATATTGVLCAGVVDVLFATSAVAS